MRLEQHRVEQRHVDVLALAGAVAVAQRGERRERGVQAREVVAEEGRRLHRLAVGRRRSATGSRSPPARAGRSRRGRASRPELAEAADRDVDHVGRSRARSSP